MEDLIQCAGRVADDIWTEIEEIDYGGYAAATFNVLFGGRNMVQGATLLLGKSILPPQFAALGIPVKVVGSFKFGVGLNRASRGLGQYNEILRDGQLERGADGNSAADNFDRFWRGIAPRTDEGTLKFLLGIF